MKGSPAHRMGSRPVHPTGQRPINPTGRGVLVYVLLVYTGFMVFFRLSYLGWSPSASDGAVPGAPHRGVPRSKWREGPPVTMQPVGSKGTHVYTGLVASGASYRALPGVFYEGVPGASDRLFLVGGLSMLT